MISAEEIAYLCEAANRYFVRQLAPGEVIWSYAGVRALYDDGEAEAKNVTRDYRLELDDDAGAEAALRLRRQDHHRAAPGRRGAGQARRQRPALHAHRAACRAATSMPAFNALARRARDLDAAGDGRSA